MENKKTKKELFGEVLAVAAVQENEELKAFVEHEIELLSKKSENKKPTKAQEENIVLKTVITDELTRVGAYEKRTIKELQAANETLAGLSNQKISALLKQLIETGEVVRTEDKRVAYFALAE